MSDKPQFTKSNVRGSTILFGIVVFVFILPDLIHYFSTEESIQFSALSSNEQRAIKQLKKRENYRFHYGKDESRYLPPPEKFNPNDYSVEQWMALGLSEKQARVMEKWRMKSNEDLRKSFVMNDELYALIKDSTFYDKQEKFSGHFEEKPLLARKIDLNTASEEELMEIKGVGAYFAKQIIKRREWLGGFYSLNQLKEIKYVDDEKLETWKMQSYLDIQSLKKININAASVEEFKAHPYVSWNLANSLVKLRSQIGTYSKVEDVKKSALMTDEIYEKLKNYLVVQ